VPPVTAAYISTHLLRATYLLSRGVTVVDRRVLALIVLALWLLAACGAEDTASQSGYSSQLPYREGTADARAILAVANDPQIDQATLDTAVALDVRAAANIDAARKAVAEVNPAAHRPFNSLQALWAVPYCKSRCLSRLLSYAHEQGIYADAGAEVVFSPAAIDNSHLAKVAAWIDAAEHSIDIAMYSYSHSGAVRQALEAAAQRGVRIRFLANSDLAKSATKGGGLETMGIDVRRVTKIMHHKMCIIDGPRDAAARQRAYSARVISGSANWSTSAATRYDENTLFMQNYAEITLRMQRDFDTLWAGSRDVVYNSDLNWDQDSANIDEGDIGRYDDANTDVHLTSFNFIPTTNGSWSKTGTTVVSDAIVAAISERATHSLKIASGHFVSVPIAQAVRDALSQRPGLDVEINLDCQETSKSGDIRDIKDDIELAGGRIVYKCNTYRWHYKYAAQMHHKYIIFDEAELWTGSLNFSDNAETGTFENMMVFQGAEHQNLVALYLKNHSKIESYGSNGSLDELRHDVEHKDEVPLSWQDPISMDLEQFEDLKDLMRQQCPAVAPWSNTPEAKTYQAHFNKNPQWFARCQKTGYPWPLVPAAERL
jgi:phosphatidylserine/phosphatidylglycerophosphate/cardiolipin synthase-like enzyme